MIGIFRESNDIKDINRENSPEISREAQSRFEAIMGDDRLTKAENVKFEEHSGEQSLLSASERFESLFRTGAVRDTKALNTDTDDSGYGIDDDSGDGSGYDNGEASDNDSGIPDETNQPHEPSSVYRIGNDTYETDTMGNTYKKNGILLPNAEYTLNAAVYRTDENGNKISCDAEPEITEEGKRNTFEQRESGGADRKEGDQGGHIIARILGGAEGEENLVPMRGTINQGDYKKMELEIKHALEEKKQVNVHIDLEYDRGSSRPTLITAEYDIDGNKTRIAFDNEKESVRLLDSLKETITGYDYDQLSEEITDMKNDGHPASVTSVKTEYDEVGKESRVIVGVLDEASGIKTYKVFDVR